MHTRTCVCVCVQESPSQKKGVAGLFETLVLTHYSTQHNVVPIIFYSLGKKMSTRVCMALREIQMRYCLVAQCRKSRFLCNHCCSPEQG